jgi:hypothetical protein
MRADKVRDLDLINPERTRSLWRVDPPVQFFDIKSDECLTSEFIVASSVIVPGSGPETYIFPADENGAILSWAELPGSQRGIISHEDVVRLFVEAESDEDE